MALPIASLFHPVNWNVDGMQTNLDQTQETCYRWPNSKIKGVQAFDNLAEQSCLTSSGFAARENKFLSCISPCYFQSLKHEAQPIRTGATATSPVVLKRRSVICPKPHHETISRDIFGCHLILYLPYLFKERKKREAQSFKA